MTTQRKRESARTKRFATLNPGIWDHGIVPYQFDADSLSGRQACNWFYLLLSVIMYIVLKLGWEKNLFANNTFQIVTSAF